MTYITKDLSSKLFAAFELLDSLCVIRDPFSLAVDALQVVGQVGCGDGALSNRALHCVLFQFQVEGLALALLVLVLLLLILGRSEEGAAGMGRGFGMTERVGDIGRVTVRQIRRLLRPG